MKQEFTIDDINNLLNAVYEARRRHKDYIESTAKYIDDILQGNICLPAEEMEIEVKHKKEIIKQYSNYVFVYDILYSVLQEYYFDLRKKGI